MVPETVALGLVLGANIGSGVLAILTSSGPPVVRMRYAVLWLTVILAVASTVSSVAGLAVLLPFVGFAIGRSIWWDALKAFLDGSISRGDAQNKIADNYLRFIGVYEDAVKGAGVA